MCNNDTVVLLPGTLTSADSPSKHFITFTFLLVLEVEALSSLLGQLFSTVASYLLIVIVSQNIELFLYLLPVRFVDFSE